MLHAKYQPYRPDGSGKEAVRIAFRKKENFIQMQ